MFEYTYTCTLYLKKNKNNICYGRWQESFKIRNKMCVLFFLIMVKYLIILYSWFYRKILKITLVRAVKIEGRYLRMQHLKLNYCETLFFSGFKITTFEQRNEFICFCFFFFYKKENYNVFNYTCKINKQKYLSKL